MAAAEILQGTNLTAYQGSLMDTINACGRTLLDTMNQVLDFSKIVSLERQSQQFERRKGVPLEMKSMHRLAAHLDAYVATDISILAEEVVEGVCLGHSHTQNSIDSSVILTASAKVNEGTLNANFPRPNVDVIIDVAANDWVYYTPPGALRRIIMNIFGNAIKYTEAGNVTFQLDAKEASESWFPHNGPREHMVTLTVSDTGKGISEGFLKSKLFVPFAQEDSLATGSGLGLSIVRSLVKSLGGCINVNSRPGSGTTVKVTLPMARSKPEGNETQSGPMSPFVRERDPVLSEFHYLRQKHNGKRVAIMNMEPEVASSDPCWANLSRYLTDWYGLILVSPSSQEPIDLILGNELPSQDQINCCSRGKNTAFLILSSKYIGRDSIRVQGPFGFKVVDLINRPCGPHKLARFIQKCLDKDTRHETIEITSLAEGLANSDLNGRPASNHESQQSGTQSSSTTPSENSIFTPNTEITEGTDSPEVPRGARILVVEDNKINLNLMLAFLKKGDFATVDSAENGSLAVSAVKQDQQGYDIIFMGKILAHSDFSPTLPLTNVRCFHASHERF
jgi:hypothetical protein